MATTTATIIRALGALLAAWGLQAHAAPLLNIEPAVALVSPGQSFSASVVIHDVTDLFAYQFDLAFNPALLEVTGVDEGGFLPGAGATIFFPGIIDNGAGLVSFVLGTLSDALDNANGTGELVRIRFQARDILGTTPLALSNIVLLDSALANIAFEPAAGGLVAVVPEPGTALLFVPLALGVGWVFGRQRGRRGAADGAPPSPDALENRASARRGGAA